MGGEAQLAWTVDEIVAKAREFMEQAREIAAEREVVQVAFIFCAGEVGGEERRVLMLTTDNFSDVEGKDAFAAMMREVAERNGGVAVLFISEAWVVSVDDADGVEAAEATSLARRQELHAHPARRERLVAALSLREGAGRLWMADLEAGNGGRRVGEFEELLPDAMGGRFTEIFE